MYLTWIILGLAAYKFKSFEGHVKCRSPIFSGELCMETKPSSRQRLPRGAEAAGSSQHLQALRSSLGFSWKHLCLHIVVTSCHFKHKNVLTWNSWFWSASTRLDQLRSHPCGHQYAHKSPIMWSLTSSFTVHMYSSFWQAGPRKFLRMTTISSWSWSLGCDVCGILGSCFHIPCGILGVQSGSSAGILWHYEGSAIEVSDAISNTQIGTRWFWSEGSIKLAEETFAAVMFDYKSFNKWGFNKKSLNLQSFHTLCGDGQTFSFFKKGQIAFHFQKSSSSSHLRGILRICAEVESSSNASLKENWVVKLRCGNRLCPPVFFGWWDGVPQLPC